MRSAAEAAARFVYCACAGTLGNGEHASQSHFEDTAESSEDAFYSQVLSEAMACLGTRVLNPAQTALREVDLYGWYMRSREEVEAATSFTYFEYMEMLDFLVLHKDVEANRYFDLPPLVRKGLQYTGAQLEFVTRALGQMLGGEIYDAYVAGRVHRRFLRSLFVRQPGSPRETYFSIVKRVQRGRKRALAV
jgi:hypothetical protein